jgi:hypothetical protein
MNVVSERTASELLGMVNEIVSKADAESLAPAQNIIAMGNALVAVGEALAGCTVQEARKVVKAVAVLNDLKV